MLIVYFLESQYEYWGWHDVFLELALRLKNDYGATIVHQKGGHLELDKFDGYKLPDCEILIHDEDKDALYGITWSESRTGLLNIFEKRNNEKDVLLVTQFNNIFPKDFDRSVYNFKLKNTVYYPFTPSTNHEYFYHQRQLLEHTNYDSLIDKVFCLFTTIRTIGLRLREEGLITESPGLMRIDEYLKMAITYKMGLALPGVAEVNFREIEYMAIGLPMLRMEYMTQLNPALIPNYHYVAVSREGFPWDMYADREGGEDYVQAYKKRYNEVKDDKEFLSFISKNAREYYTQYCNPYNRMNHLINLLEL
jgi:hypothetical protein